MSDTSPTAIFQEPTPISLHLELGARLGEGGVGRVVAARDPVAGIEVALKFAVGDAQEAMLSGQFLAGGLLRHPNVATYRGLERLEDGRLALLQERIRGASLADCMPLPIEDRVGVALGVCRGVCALHAWGACHGDLSPNNVLLEQGRPRLIDFGASGAARYATPGYIGPEVARGGPSSAAADVYSLGCLLYEVLAGERLLEPSEDGGWLDADPTPPPLVLEHFGGVFAEVLTSCLVPDPDARPRAWEVLERLAEAFEVEADPERGVARAAIGPRPAGMLEAPLDLLNAALDDLASGRGRCIELAGSAGSGRTEALRTAATSAALANFVPVSVTPAPGTSAFAAVARAFRVEVQGAREPAVRLARALTEAAELRRRVLLVDATAADPGDRHLLWEALRTACNVSPLVAMVTSNPGPRLGAHRATLPVLDAVGRGRTLARSLQGVVPVALGVWFEWAAPETPRRLNEMLHHLVEVGALVWKGAWRLIEQRLPQDSGALGDSEEGALEGHPLLRALLCLERAATGAELAAVAAMEPEEAGEALESLRARGVLRSGGAGVYTLAQPDVVGAPPQGEALAALHLRAAALPRTGVPFEVRTLARTTHQILAGEGPTLDECVAAVRALSEARRFARATLVLSALERRAQRPLDLEWARLELARGDLRRGRALLEDMELEGEARVEQARLLCRCGGYSAALALLEKEAGAGAELVRADARLWLGQRERAWEAAREFFHRADLPPKLRARAAQIAANSGWQVGELAEAARLALEGLGLCGAERGLRADLFMVLGVVRFFEGRLEEARVGLAEAITENRSLGRLPELAKCLNRLGQVDSARGKWARAAETWEEFRLISGRSGDAVQTATALNNLGHLRLRLGETRRAVDLLRRCIEVAEEADYIQLVPTALSNLGASLIQLGDFDAAAEAFNQALPGTVYPGRFELERRMIELDVMRGHFEQAGKELHRRLVDSNWDPQGTERAHLLRLLSVCERLGGRARRSADASRQALAYFQTEGLPFEVALCREEHARALEALGSMLEASREAAAAADGYQALGAHTHAERAGGLYRTLVRAAKEERRQAGGREALLEIAQHLGSARDIATLVPLVLDRAVELTSAERGAFALYDEEGQLTQAVAHGLDWPGLPWPLPVSHRVLDQVLETGAPVLVQDVHTEGEYGRRHSVRLLGLRSMVGVPVHAGNGVRGVVYVDSSTTALTDLQQEVELLEAFAGLVGISVHNARLFDELQFRNELLGTMAHDFRTPLGVILANLGVLSELEDKDREEATSEMQAATVRMARMIDNTLELVRAQAGAPTPEPHSLVMAEVIGEHLRGLDRLAHSCDRRIEFHAPEGLPTAMTRADRLWIVLDNLVFNAIKYAPARTAVRVSVQQRSDPGPARARSASRVDLLFRHEAPLKPRLGSPFLEVSVFNEGPPVPAELLPTLFDPFVRGGESQGGVKSTGLGLSIVDRCVTRLGGRLWVDSRADFGTRFVFTLPSEVQP